MFDLTDVKYVKRIAVGSTDPERLSSEETIKAEADLLNKCLSNTAGGKIIGIEKTFSLLNIGEHQVVLQVLIYHVGFPRKPYWLEDSMGTAS